MWSKALIPIVAVVVTFIITSLLIILADAIRYGIYNFIVVPLSSKFSALEVLVKATPLIFTVCCDLCFCCRLLQTWRRRTALRRSCRRGVGWSYIYQPSGNRCCSLELILGFAAVCYGIYPCYLKIKLKVDEVVTTLLMNSIIMYFIRPFERPWRDPETGWPKSPEFFEAARFVQLIPKSRLHLGFIIAMVYGIDRLHCAQEDPPGLQMRAVGASKAGAQFAGINVNRTMLIAALVSGGIAGLQAFSEIAGIHYHLISELSGVTVTPASLLPHWRT
jgi:simple sugar transport system permease protein